MTYQWYPGHMTKTLREMQEDIRLVDLIIELADARIRSPAGIPRLTGSRKAGHASCFLENPIWRMKKKTAGGLPSIRRQASLPSLRTRGITAP
jgi:hypothetical protein